MGTMTCAGQNCKSARCERQFLPSDVRWMYGLEKGLVMMGEPSAPQPDPVPNAGITRFELALLRR